MASATARIRTHGDRRFENERLKRYPSGSPDSVSQQSRERTVRMAVGTLKTGVTGVRVRLDVRAHSVA